MELRNIPMAGLGVRVLPPTPKVDLVAKATEPAREGLGGRGSGPEVGEPEEREGTTGERVVTEELAVPTVGLVVTEESEV